jgi:hypothetical protein
MKTRKALVPAGCLIALWLSAGTALAQYTPYNPYTSSPYRTGQRARLPPSLNMIRNEVPDVVDYFLGTIPERERRFNEVQFNTRIRNLELRAPEAVPAPTEEEIPGVPTAGKPIGTRSSASYFKTEPPAALQNHRAALAQHHRPTTPRTPR